MKLTSHCIPCIEKQVNFVARNLTNCDNGKLQTLQNELVTYLKGEYDNQNISPAESVKNIYAKLNSMSSSGDPFKELKDKNKKEAMIVADEIINNFGEQMTLELALKIAVCGNIIDYAQTKEFDLDKTFKTISETEFTIFDLQKFRKFLRESKSMLYMLDNSGEHIFDKFLIKEIKKEYPNLKIYLFAKDGPIINDITIKEAKGEFDNIYSSGNNIPGFLLKYASKEAKEIYDSVDFLLAKGMGHYESLTEEIKKPTFLLFRVKCEAVSESINCPVSSNIFKLYNKE